MRRIKVCIYGGTDLQGIYPAFISTLAYKLLDSSKAVSVTGGFRHSNDHPESVSTDVTALRGAKRYAIERGIDLKDCYEAWIPDPEPDSRLDVKGAVRLSNVDGITVLPMTGRTPLGRRLAMVAGVDMA